MPEKLNITDWAKEDRPREKLMAQGRQNLSDAELIALLISSGNTKETAVELSKRILKSVNNNLNKLGTLSVTDLMKFKGIGLAKAISIVAALELGRRRKLSDAPEKKQINSSMAAFEIMHPVLENLPHEEFWVLFLNRANKLIDKQKISQGGMHGTVADVRLIMKMAIEKLASAIIICHNHPSETLKPSKNDDKLTQQIKDACNIMQISLLDHIIIAGKDFFSYTDQGKL